MRKLLKFDIEANADVVYYVDNQISSECLYLPTVYVI